MTFLQLIQTLTAASGDGNAKSRRVRPLDLDIYNEPDIASQEQQAIPELRPPQVILTNVSAVRKRIWKFKDVALSTYDRAESAVTSVKQGVVDAYETAKSDPLSMLRPGCIAVAVLAGGVVHGRGRKPVLRLATATVAGTLVASVAYPERALKAGKQIYYNGKDAGISLVDLMKNWAEKSKTVEVKEVAENTAETIDLSASKSDDGVEMKGQGIEESSLVVLDANGEEVCLLDAVEGKSEVGVEDVESEQQLPTKPDFELDGKERAGNKGEHKIIQGQELTADKNNGSSFEDTKRNSILVDYGQSSPEDNDMYSTRS